LPVFCRLQGVFMGNPIALITGATSGIGLAWAERLAREGYDLIATGRRMELLRERMDDIAARHGRVCRAVEAELSTDDGITSLCRLVAATPDLAILVCNAGYTLPGPFEELDTGKALALLRTHDLASVALARAALPAMLKRAAGTMVFVSSLAALIPRAGSELYTPSKAFLNSFATCLDMSYRKQGLCFQALCPGFTHSDFHERAGKPKDKEGKEGKEKLVHWMSAQAVVDEAWQKLGKGRVICVPGAGNRTLVRLLSFLPVAVRYRILSR
jgi:hypothetical protein